MNDEKEIILEQIAKLVSLRNRMALKLQELNIEVSTSDTFNVLVGEFEKMNPRLTSITVSPEFELGSVGDEIQITYTVNPPELADKVTVVGYQSSDTTILDVSQTGKVIINKSGLARITTTFKYFDQEISHFSVIGTDSTDELQELWSALEEIQNSIAAIQGQYAELRSDIDNILEGYKPQVVISKTDFDALETKDPDTVYLVWEE